MEDRHAEEVETEEAETEAETVDLNRVFAERELDLNSMFPDGEMRNFLRQIHRNRRSNLRFLEGFKREKIWEDDG